MGNLARALRSTRTDVGASQPALRRGRRHTRTPSAIDSLAARRLGEKPAAALRPRASPRTRGAMRRASFAGRGQLGRLESSRSEPECPAARTTANSGSCGSGWWRRRRDRAGRGDARFGHSAAPTRGYRRILDRARSRRRVRPSATGDRASRRLRGGHGDPAPRSAENAALGHSRRGPRHQGCVLPGSRSANRPVEPQRRIRRRHRLPSQSRPTPGSESEPSSCSPHPREFV